MNEISVAQELERAKSNSVSYDDRDARMTLEIGVSLAIDKAIEKAIGYPSPVQIVPVLEVGQDPASPALTDLKIVPKPAATAAGAIMFNAIPSYIDRLLKEGRIVHMVAVFVGEDGSMGFKRGAVYNLALEQQGPEILLQTEGPRERLTCPYTSIASLLQNWRAVRSWSGSRDRDPGEGGGDR